MPDDPSGLLETIAAGLAQHQAGHFEAAEGLYREILARNPAEPLTLYLYGSLALATDQPDKAEGLLAKAVALRPEHVEARFAYANSLHRQDARQDAIRHFRALLKGTPDHLGARVNLSNCLREEGNREAALAEADTALTLAPASPAAAATRGAALLALGRQDAAIAAYGTALEADPRHVAAHAGLAASLLHADRPAEALAYADAALLLSPALAEAHFLRAMALVGLDAGQAAVTELRCAIALDPAHAKAHLNLANLLADGDQSPEAERLYRRAIALEPKLTEAYASLGHLLIGSGRLTEAVAACDRALAIEPDCVQAHWNQGIAWLLAGDYEKGWEKYEVRRDYRRFPRLYPDPEGPLWQGEDLTGRAILVIAEQGLGDTIQFARYLPLLAARGASVVLACDRALVPLLSGQTGVALAVERGQPFPPYDCWVNQMSLPYRFRTRLDSVPFAPGYLRADPGRTARWRKRLPPLPDARIGLVWAGNPRHSNDARRSMRLADLVPLLGIPGATFVSLQIGAAAAQLEDHPDLLEFSSELSDFAETASLIQALDLIISVDTSSAHCAAALGKETWLMLPYAPDWRWLLERPDSPWYAAARLFRQPRPGAWPDVVRHVGVCLQDWLAAGNSSDHG